MQWYGCYPTPLKNPLYIAIGEIFVITSFLCTMHRPEVISM